MTKKIKFLIPVFIFSILLIASCQKEDLKQKPIIEEKEDENLDATFVISFDALFNNEKLTFNEMKWVTTSGDTMNFARIRMILSNLKLVKTDDTEVSLDTFAFISLDEKRSKIGFNKPLPVGNYKGFKFDIGLEPSINNGDPEQWGQGHPLNPLVNQMHWTWATGYIFMVVEGHYMKNGDKFSIFSFHMANNFYKKSISTESSSGFSIVNGSKTTLNLQMHMDKYFDSPNKHSLKENGANSHSNSQSERLIMDNLFQNLDAVFVLQ
jgi:hypothetical protein